MKSAAEDETKATGSTDIEVSGDGTWQKRGHTSLNGAVTLIGVKSGKVIDVDIMSRYCHACVHYKGVKHGETYDMWWEDHAPHCAKNHEGSAGKMEADGMLRIFKRSENERGVRYVKYIGDGDAKTFKCISDDKPYGPDVCIEKKECVGHVQKKMGGKMRALKQSMKGQKLSDGKGISGVGRLTDKFVNKLQQYYGNAIRSNCSDLKSMKDAVWAIYHHSKSTDEKHNHTLCPKGEGSWCKYQKAVVDGTELNFKHGKKEVPPVVIKATKKVFQDLACEELLKRWVKTQ
jgi:hypothetical protein